MSMRSKSEDEINFNKLARKYGRTSFTSDDFDKDPKLKEALISFIKAKTFVLADDFSNLSEFTEKHNEFLRDKLQFKNAQIVYDENIQVEYTQKLFKISCQTTAKQIACDYYCEVFESGCNIFIDAHGEKYQDVEINDTIDRFHIFCENVNRAKLFIQTQFPRWQHADTKEKKKIRSDIKTLLNNLEILKIDIKLRDIMLYFASNYKFNKEDTFKADVLLALNLPNIDSHDVSKRIVKNLISPYGSYREFLALHGVPISADFS